MAEQSRNGGEQLFLATASEGQARTDAVLPNQGSEDASHLLNRSSVELPSAGIVQKIPDYLPNGKVDWVIHLDFRPEVILQRIEIEQAITPSWREKHQHPTLFGFSPEGNRWTYVNAGGVPETYTRLQLAWKLRSLEDDVPLSVERLKGYLVATKEVARKLDATSVRPGESPEEAADRSADLIGLVEACNLYPIVGLKALPGARFEGRQIWDVMLCLGLRWGDMDLFHWNNPGIPGDDHLFSVWTSTPPGYFLPEQIAAGRVRTLDLIFGFSAPRTFQPEQVFDAMLRAVRYSDRRLGGEIVDVDGSPLSEGVVKARIRQTVQTLGEAGFAPGSDDALYLF